MAATKVELFDHIRRDSSWEGLSVRALARKYGVHRRLVREALTHAEPTPRKTPTRRSPQLEPFKEIIDGWLRADLDAPRKQRHSIKQIHARLLDEHDAQVSYSAVRDYVSRCREEIRIEEGRGAAKVFVPQHHPPGQHAATALEQARAAGAFTAAHEAFWSAARRAAGEPAATRELTGVLLLHRHMDDADVIAGIGAALSVGAHTADVVAAEARKVADARRGGLDSPGGETAGPGDPATPAPGAGVTSLTMRRIAALPPARARMARDTPDPTMTTPPAAPPASAHTSERAAWAREAARTPLLGRADELRHLSTAAEHAGRPLVIAVTGPPGVGKSRLLRYAAAIQETRGRVVLQAACRPGGQARKLGLASDLVTSAASVTGPGGRAAPRTAAPQGPTPGRPETALEDRGALVHLASLAQSAPVCVYVDDIHWADPESLAWLGDLRGRLTGQDVRIVASVSEWAPQPEPLKSLLAGVKRIGLRPLSAAAVATIVAYALGPADPAFTAGLFERTRGNPKLTHNLVAELRNRGTHPDDTGTRVLDAAADDVLASFTRPILLDLPLEAVLLAHAVFLLGSAADTETVTRVSGLDDGAAAGAVQRLRQTGLLDQRGDLLELRYPAVSDVVESILSAEDVAGSRLMAARILCTRQDTAERGATLLLAVAPQGQRWIADQLTDAARQAMARRDVATAVKMLGRALTEVPGDAREGSIRESLAAAEAVFDPDRAVAQLGGLLSQAADPVDRVRLTDLLAEAFLNGGRPADAIAAIDAELATAAAADGAVLQTLIARRYLLDIEEPGLRMLREGRKAAGGGPDPRGGGKARGAADAGPPLAATAAGELAATGGGTPVALAAAMGLTLAYRLQDAAAYLDRVIESAREGGCAAQWARASAQRAEVAFRAGDLAAAASRARESLELTRWVMTPLRLSAAATLARALVEQAELEEAGAVLALVPSQDREDWRWGEVLHARGALRLAQGDLWGGLDDLYTCGRLQQAHGRHAPAHNEWRLLAAPTLAELGDEREAVSVATEAYRLARRSGIPALAGAALRVLGVVSGNERRVRAAVTALEQSPARLELAKALTEQAACQLRGRPAEARETLRLASSLAGACGAHGLEPRLDQLMISAGGRPRRPASGLRALTRRQLAVATHAARGLTNREIAEELVLTQRTVELHLTNAYKKLDIHSRSQLQRIVTEEAEEASGQGG